VVRGPRELIEDACQTAWATLLQAQPNQHAIFAWLRVVAIHEAYRLSAIDRRDARLEGLGRDDGDWHEVIADARSLDDAIEALEALRALASLPERRRIDFALKVAGYSYEEIRTRTPGRTRTNVSKSLAKSRAQIRRMRPSRIA
jgi:DNA-directed RNA polymerase specialized sigma24 family protein